MNKEAQKTGEVEMSGVDNPSYTVSTNDVNVSVTRTSDVSTPDTFSQKTKDSLVIDRRFGYGSFKLKSFQLLNKMWIFTIWLVIFCFLEGFAINGVANAGLPAIERQFQLTSTKSSLIPASQDFGALVLVLFVSFIGGRYNKAVWIATGSIIMALGSFFFIIPHLAEKHHWEGASGPSGPGNPCSGGGGPGGPPCDSEGEKYVGVFMLAQILHGIGFTPMFTLGIVYLDDNAGGNNGALYLGLCYASTAVGVASGFFAGGQILQNMFVDFDRVDQDTLGFDAKDTRWVGAWWFGFVFTAVAFLLVSIPIFGYPKYMPGNQKAEEQEKALKNESDVTFGKLVIETALSILKAFVQLIKNPVYIFLTLGGCTEALIIFGISAFSFKYLVEMYNLPFDQAGNYLGGLILVGSLGMFLGGFLIRVFKLEIFGMIRINIVVTLLAAVLGISFLAKCPEANLAGLRTTYPGESLIDGYSASCHDACSCDGAGFNPVCGDGTVYFSACHAGCSVAPATPMGSYTNCSCVAASLNISADSSANAKAGRCPDGCTNVDILLPCLFIMMVAVLTVTTPQSMATLRCVDEEIRPFALGVGWVLFRLLGSIPGPVLVGAVLDGACEIWQGSACGGDGVCMLYNKKELSLYMMLWWVILTVVTSALFMVALFLVSRKAKKSFSLKD